MFESLFSPLDIGPVTIENRIQITPHEQQYFSNGLPTETLVRYYAERAEGGAGLLEVSQLYVTAPDGYSQPDWENDSSRRFPMANSPEIIPGLKKLSDAVHKFGAKIFMEVSIWPGPYGLVSSIPSKSGEQLRELSISDILEIQELFADASKYVKEGGFDGIDLHGSHGALIEHFYSPATNRRSDRYGGSIENRLRFLSELIGTVRSSIGEKMAVGMRLCADEKVESGVTLEYAAKMAELLDGKLDFLNVDAGAASQFEVTDQHTWQTQPLYAATGYGVYLAEAVKKSVKKTKVGAVGRILDPLLADHVIKLGSADYVGMTRALIADPELPNKAKEGRLEDIRPCIGTLQDCWGRSVTRDWPMRCTVNPSVGKERERGIHSLKRAVVKKKILVIGSGPAGLEVARVASERGHEVVLYEKDGKVGGQVNLAKLLPGRADIGAIITWYEGQIKKNQVRVEYHKEIPAEKEVVQYVLSEEKHDIVVISTGSHPLNNGLQMITYREIPGWDKPNVHTVDDVLIDGKGLKGKIIVADSTNYIFGPGIAEWLARKSGASVTLVTPHPNIPQRLSGYNQLVHIARRLSDARVTIHPFSWVSRINDGSVTISHFIQRSEEELEADHVVINTGRTQFRDLAPIFANFAKEIHEIGDCNIAGGTIREAIEEGYKLGSGI